MKTKRTGQANLGNRPDSSARRILELLSSHGALISGLQEAGDRRFVVEKWCKANGYDSYFGEKHEGAPSTPLIWSKALRVTNVGTREATKATYTGKLGAGPPVVKPKVWNHARVHGLGAESFVFINGHLPASLYLPRRRALAKRQIAVLVEMIEKREDRGVPVVVVGDFNCRPNALILKPLRRLGMVQRTRKPTHGRRLIDHVWTLDVKGETKVIQIPSDHNGVVFEPVA